MDLPTMWVFGLALLISGGAMLTFARRFKNTDPNAGYGVAGWTVFLIICWLVSADAFMK